MDELTKMWQDSLTSEFLGEPYVEISDFLKTFGVSLGTQSTILNAAYCAFLQQKENYDYSPMIGAPLVFDYDFSQEIVVLKRFEDQQALTFKQFRRYMGLIDLIFSEVYPVGSVVELDQEKLPGEVREMFKGGKSDLLVTIHARRVPSKDGHNYIDYIGTVWPFGMMRDVTPLLLNNMLIKRVVAAGLTNDEEKEYVNETLKKDIVMDGLLSIAYLE
ncbi:DUF4176 domain-containing protein [Ligilactobacillus pobuzihii]|uniref:DUF4176 domain-containing protein n=1 Tax=Ligilactobacillus pobuzihii TaxID=449659 RepID=UPI0019CFBF25|nr:DUF4176 domain-containing protein [Ligilactobacillus pobuzihii]MBN7274912.1 DUF4176 domain-containing protein [Ligilactobacillus pobuzihii]